MKMETCNHRHTYDGYKYDYCPDCELLDLKAEGNY